MGSRALYGTYDLQESTDAECARLAEMYGYELEYDRDIDQWSLSGEYFDSIDDVMLYLINLTHA